MTTIGEMKRNISYLSESNSTLTSSLSAVTGERDSLLGKLRELKRAWQRSISDEAARVRRADQSLQSLLNELSDVESDRAEARSDLHDAIDALNEIRDRLLRMEPRT